MDVQAITLDDQAITSHRLFSETNVSGLLFQYLGIGSVGFRSTSKYFRELSLDLHTVKLPKEGIRWRDPERRGRNEFLRNNGNQIKDLSVTLSPLGYDAGDLTHFLFETPYLKILSLNGISGQEVGQFEFVEEFKWAKKLEVLKLGAFLPSGVSTPFFEGMSLEKFKKLKHLEIFSELTSGQADILNGLEASSLPDLESITLSASVANQLAPNAGFLRKQIGGGKLTKLILKNHDANGVMVSAFTCAAISTAMEDPVSQLRALHLSDVNLTVAALESLIPRDRKPNYRITSLELSKKIYLGNDDRAVDAILVLLAAFPNIQRLELANIGLNNQHAKKLAKGLLQAVELKSLTISSNPLADDGAAALLSALPANLEELYMHGISATDATAVTISERLEEGRFPNLWGLGLNGNLIGDIGAERLARALTSNRSLADIGVTFRWMTDAGCASLSKALKRMPRLRMVFLYRGTKFGNAHAVTEKGIAEMRKALPSGAMLYSGDKVPPYDYENRPLPNLNPLG